MADSAQNGEKQTANLIYENNGDANGADKKPADDSKPKDIVVDGAPDENFPFSEGLSSAEADKLLQEYGRNELPEKITPPWLVFLKQFRAPMPMMIWIAIIVEVAIGNYLDAGILFLIQMTNATIGFYETQKSGNAVAALKASLKPEATVKRDGKMVTLDAALLVPGDLVLLASGSAVPADCVVNDGIIEIDQAALTGESLPVKMKRLGEPKMGSTAVRGEVEATVRYTGVSTFFGKTADLLNTQKGTDHLQKMLLTIVFVLTGIAIVLVITDYVYVFVKFGSGEDAIEFAVAVLVASIPLAMEIVVVTTLALGSRQLAEHGAIVTRLAAIEDLSGMNILCSDKTGTLTLNTMVIQEDTPVFLPDLTQNKVLVLAALAAKWKEPPRDALDTLVLTSADLKECDTYEQLDFTPFDPSTKYTAATVKDKDGVTFRVIKGAPHVVLNLCGDEKKEAVEEAVTEFGRRGIRSLAVGRTFDDSENYQFAGILTFLDPPRPDTKETIHRAYAYGVDVKMITGDQLLIAKETARQLSMGTNIMDPSGLPDFEVGGDVPKDLGDKYGDLAFHSDGFAQVYPEHKFLIVETLRQMGFGVGMTGDGVNDAPALKQADVGIAVSGATDAARAAADIVLTEPGLSTIIVGIQVARRVFQRMQNFLTYRIAATLQLVFFFTIALFALEPRTYNEEFPDFFQLPVLLLIFITLLNDGTMIAIGYDNVISGTRPAKWNLRALFFVSSVIGAVSCVSSLLLLFAALDSCGGANDRASNGIFDGLALPCVFQDHPEERKVQFGYGQIVMMVYLKVAVSDFLTLFSARTGTRPWWTTKPSPILIAGAGFSLLVTTVIASVWTPGSLDDKPVAGLVRSGYRLYGLWVWVYSFIVFLLQDALKVGAYWLMNKFDLFNYRSGAMVATRDSTSFDDPNAAKAAGYVETKALDAALADGAKTFEKLARESAHSGPLQRVSNTMALGRKSLAVGIGRPSLVTVHEASDNTNAMKDVDAVEAELRAVAGTLHGVGSTEVDAAMSRVSSAVADLRRVSQAVDQQRLGRASRAKSSEIKRVEGP